MTWIPNSCSMAVNTGYCSWAIPAPFRRLRARGRGVRGDAADLVQALRDGVDAALLLAGRLGNILGCPGGALNRAVDVRERLVGFLDRALAQGHVLRHRLDGVDRV